MDCAGGRKHPADGKESGKENGRDNGVSHEDNLSWGVGVPPVFKEFGCFVKSSYIHCAAANPSFCSPVAWQSGVCVPCPVQQCIHGPE
ncbi:hypothetical protein StoSoilB20_14470 [Arthrobacter sp. StoSoilB20]|nr:hypothetical protein StoSoilB20_14470 [Arthrobacter sp. StoSoilB20]